MMNIHKSDDLWLPLDDLRKALDVILTGLHELGIDQVPVKHDYYWEIPESSLYDPYEKPSPNSLTLGQLHDDWSEIQRIIRGEIDPIAYHLVVLASLARYAGQKTIG
jgi:hypothetical protein